MNKPRFTPAEVEAAKVIRMLFPDAETVKRTYELLGIRNGLKILMVTLDADKFPSIAEDEIVKLDDILACGGAQ